MPQTAVAISGSPSRTSRSRQLLAHVLVRAAGPLLHATERDFAGGAPADCIVDRVDQAVAKALAFSTLSRPAFAGAR